MAAMQYSEFERKKQLVAQRRLVAPKLKAVYGTTALMIREQAALVEQMMLQNYSKETIRKALEEQHAKRGMLGQRVSSRKVEELIRRVRQQWVLDDEDKRPFKRTQTIRRLQMEIRQCFQKGAYGAMVQAERLLAEIEGLREPDRVQVNVTVQSALTEVIGRMSEEEIDRIAMAQQELRTKAALAEAVNLTIDTTGEEVRDA